MKECAENWSLPEDFIRWVGEACIFANTLADRIVTGYPHADAEGLFDCLEYRDELLTACEIFYFWAVENSQKAVQLSRELPFDKAGLNVIFSEDIGTYRVRNRLLLNGAYICLAPAALLAGFKTMASAMNNKNIKKYLEKALFKEIISTLDINKNALEGYAKSVVERFSNPYIRHGLHEITVNCVFKFKQRILPAILEYQRRFGKLPPVLIFSFAAMIAFYKNGGRFEVLDDEKNAAFLRDNELNIIFKNVGFWEFDIEENKQLCAGVEEAFKRIKLAGVMNEIARLASE